MSTVSRPFAFREVPLHGLLGLGGLLWIGWTVFAMTHSTRAAFDEDFITFRLAQLLAEGHGFAFNPGESLPRLTAPGFPVLLSGLYLFTGAEIPWLGTLVCTVCLLVAALLLLRQGLVEGCGFEALLGGTLLLLSANLWPFPGS